MVGLVALLEVVMAPGWGHTAAIVFNINCSDFGYFTEGINYFAATRIVAIFPDCHPFHCYYNWCFSCSAIMIYIILRHLYILHMYQN